MGIITGTVLVIAACTHGIYGPRPGPPGFLSIIAGIAIEWVGFTAAATLAAELLRRHHKAVAASAWRAAGSRGRSVVDRLTGWAGRRWQRRWAPAADVLPEAPPGAIQGPAGLAPMPATIPVAAPAAAVPPMNGDTPVTTATEPIPAGPPMGAPRARGARLPAPSALWRALAAAAADFVPESEAEAAEWLREQAAGLLAYAEGVMGAHANTVDEKGVDPVAMRGVHAAADIVAEAGGQIANGAAELLRYFAEVREFVQAGKKMTHDGRWITGEGDN
jgi:hypothetical protein